jgi:DNA-binding transcriptional ArsR family regulator
MSIIAAMAPRPKPDAHRAMSHPVRGLILATMGDRVLSPTQLAQELQRPLGTVAYHVRVLLDAGFIEEVGTSQRRGAIQHHYRVRGDGGNTSLRLHLTQPEIDALTDDIRTLVDQAAATAAERESAPDEEAPEEIIVAVLRTAAVRPD